MQKKQNKSWKNKLYFGDNLDILRDKIPDNFIDLIYLDPPFKSGKAYNIIFQPEAGKIKGATAQIKTFEDTWRWGTEAQKNYEGLINGTITKEKPSQKLIELMKTMRGYLSECSTMAYLSMMAPRLLEMRRVLKNTGSIYLHCDPTASHYLKLLMDAIFGVENFRNEIIWKRQTAKKGSQFRKRTYGSSFDSLLFYTKTDNHYFEIPRVQLSEEEMLGKFNKIDKSGRRFRLDRITLPKLMARKNLVYEYKSFVPQHGWMVSKDKLQKMDKENRIYWTKDNKPYRKYFMDEYKGKEVSNIWIDIFIASGNERIGYPTQKPEKLLERIIKASSPKGGLVLDPFCGCGTTVAVAERLGRKWIGIDITYLAIVVISKRLEESKMKEGIDFEIDGEPKDVYSAKRLAKKDSFQFQIWCISKLDATPSETRTGDKGVDGIINFLDPFKTSKVGKAVIQVKGTENVNPSMVRDLKGTLKSQEADFGILITFRKPTQGMIDEATKEGHFKFMKREIPKIQFLTVEDLFKEPIPLKLPQMIFPPYRKPIIEKELEKELQKKLFDK